MFTSWAGRKRAWTVWLDHIVAPQEYWSNHVWGWCPSRSVYTIDGLRSPFNNQCFFSAHWHWKKGVNFLKGRGVPANGVAVFLCFLEVKRFALPVSDFIALYFRVLSWWSENEVSPVLFFSNLCTPAYYTNCILCCTMPKNNTVWLIALSEHLFFCLNSFLGTVPSRPTEKVRRFGGVQEISESGGNAAPHVSHRPQWISVHFILFNQYSLMHHLHMPVSSQLPHWLALGSQLVSNALISMKLET